MTYKEAIAIPPGVSCVVEKDRITCSKGGKEITRKVDAESLKLKVEGSNIIFETKSDKKNDLKVLRSYRAHINNMFYGLDEQFVYHLQTCNVHFPMTLKLEKNKLLINNFLGEKKQRSAEIIPSVTVDIKGANITVSSHDRDAAGQTAANIEKATLVRNRDRRVFQDGIYITDRPGRKL
ncbi:MAG TPA: 50S ribosomal protein L6 [Candidatus Nanoarchaeia archaeon]|nr:50S ribosomal protein L6 [Candidatus Nanoarchaeia archaeon]